jgi:hypothetical protein
VRRFNVLTAHEITSMLRQIAHFGFFSQFASSCIHLMDHNQSMIVFVDFQKYLYGTIFSQLASGFQIESGGNNINQWIITRSRF